MRNEDLDDLSEELWEDLKLSTNALNAVKDSLNATLPLARHLQTDIFLWEPIALHPVFFFISSIMLFVALMSSSYKRRYKAVLYIASVFSAFALAFAFVIAIGSLEALNAIFDGNKSSSQKALGDGITIRRGKNLDYCQSGLVAATALFYVVLGFLFVRRRPENFQKA